MIRSPVMRMRLRSPGVWLVAAACLVVAHTAWQGWRAAEAPYPAQYDYDEGVYAETAAAAARGERLYSPVFLSQPPVLVAALAGAYHVWGASLTVARGVVIFGSAVWLGALFSIPAAAGLDRAGTLAVCAALGSTAFLTAAHAVQMEGPSEALAAVAVAAAVFGVRGPGTLWWAIAGVLAGLAVLTKLTAAACAVPLVIVAILGLRGRNLERAPSGWLGPSAARLGALVVGAAAAVAAWLPVIAAPGFVAEVVRFHLALARHLGPSPAAHARTLLDFLLRAWPLSVAAGGGVWAAFARPAQRGSRRLGTAGAAPPNQVIEPRSRASGAPGRDALPWRAERSSETAPGPAFAWLPRAIIAWLAVECAVVLAITPLWPHHLALLISPLSLLAGLGADSLWDRRPASWRAAAGTAAACAAVAIYVAAGVRAAGSPAQSAALHHVVEEVARSTPPRTAVVTDDPMVPFLAGRPVPPGLIDTSEARIESGRLRAGMLDAAIADPGVRAVVLWRGTFRRVFPGFVAQAYRQFRLERARRGGRAVLLRTPIHTQPNGSFLPAPDPPGGVRHSASRLERANR